ncbi:MAG: hypothetical protein AAF555_02950 [Verrucomicrobiota bacterium]
MRTNSFPKLGPYSARLRTLEASLFRTPIPLNRSLVRELRDLRGQVWQLREQFREAEVSQDSQQMSEAQKAFDRIHHAIRTVTHQVRAEVHGHISTIDLALRGLSEFWHRVRRSRA